MNKLKLFFAVSLAIIALFSCKKNEQDTSFKDVNRISLGGDPLEYATTDSLLFSFAVYPSGQTQAQVSVIAKVMGQLSAEDRVFKIEVDPLKTTALPEEYILPSTFVIKAGAAESRVPLILKRSSRIQSGTVKLSVKLVPNENFEAAVKSSYNILWTDELTKPTNWEGTGSVGFYFGKYSKVKHRLVVDATEYKNLAVLSGNYNALFYIASRALEDLNAYNAAHPGNPLKNEGGVAIGICSSCE